MKRIVISSLCLLYVLAIGSIPTSAQWNPNTGLTLAIDQNSYRDWNVVPDQDGGFWFSYKATEQNDQFYIQRYDSIGYPYYSGPGISVVDRSVFTDSIRINGMVPDHEGGVILSYKNMELNGDHTFGIYAQKINRFGEYEWGASGVLTVQDRGAYYNYMPAACVDNASGMFQRYAIMENYDNLIGVQHTSNTGVISFEVDELVFDFETRTQPGIFPSNDATSAFIIGTDYNFHDSLFCAKVDVDGSVEWQTAIRNTWAFGILPETVDLLETDNGDIWVTWSSRCQPMVAKLDENGAIIIPDSSMFPDFFDDHGDPPQTQLVCDDEGSAYLGFVNDDRYNELYINKMTLDGNLPWGDSGIFIDESGDFGFQPEKMIWDQEYQRVVFGYRSETFDEEQNEWVECYKLQGVTSEGDLVWGEEGIVVIYEPTRYTEIHTLSDGSYLTISAGERNGGGILKAGKVYPDGTVADYSMTVNQPSTTVTEWQLLSVYPNPFNSTVTVPFFVPNTSQIEIVVYNMIGQKVSTIVNKHIEAGYHLEVWNGMDINGESVASGVYFINMSSPGFTSSRKVVVMK